MVLDQGNEFLEITGGSMRSCLCSVFLIFFFVGLLSMPAGCSDRRTYKNFEGEVPRGDVARVVIPQYMEVVSLDGEGTGKWLQKLFVSGVEKELVLLPGTHTIAVVYVDIWPVDDNDSEKLRSDPLVLQFRAEAGGKYRVVGHEPEDLESARRYEANFTVRIVEAETGERMSR
jgi:hypothetical protein